MSKKPPSENVARSAGIVGIAVMLSRVLGLVREMVFTSVFGAGRELDAFIVAFRVPNTLRDLFAEGALSTAFITTFTKKLTTEGDASAWRLANKMRTLTVVFMSGVTALGIIFAPQIVALMAPGFDPAKRDFTILLTRIMFPFILMVSLAALVMGMLNAKKVFGMPAMASSFFNIGSIVGGVGFGWLIDPSFGPLSMVGMAIGTLIGGWLQLLVQLPSLKTVGFKPAGDFKWRDEGVKTILRLMGPAVIAASAVQVNVAVNSIFASNLGDGPMAWLNCAFRLMQLPLGIFGVGIATATLPVVSRSAALGDMAHFRSTLARATRLTFLLTIPSAVGLVILGVPIISLIYERGRFDWNASQQTGSALQFYALGLIGYAGLKVVTPAFYAINKRMMPMIVSIVSIALNIGLNFLFTVHLHWGHRGLAFSTGLIAMINYLVLHYLMSRAAGGMEGRAMISSVIRISIAAFAMGLVCYFGQIYLLTPAWHYHFLVRLVALTGLIGVAGAVFLGFAILLRIEETQDLVSMVRRKLRR